MSKDAMSKSEGMMDNDDVAAGAESDDSLREDYLWDRSGAVDPEVAELEEVLGALRFQRSMPAVDPPTTRPAPSKLLWLAVAAGVAFVVWGWMAREGAEVAPPVARMALPTVQLSATVAATQGPSAPLAGPAWEVTALGGQPTCDGKPVTASTRLERGQWLQTDESSKARVEVAGLGTLELEPGSRLRLVASREHDRRVELAVGKLRAVIAAPARVFTIEAPNVRFVDLGCEYELEVSEDGSSRLRVELGWVAAEGKDRTVVVPAGSQCEVAADGTPGLPLRRAASAPYVAAARDFARASEGLFVLLGQAQTGDVVTLFNVLGRVALAERRGVFDRLVELAGISPPDAEAVLRLDKSALEAFGRQLGALPPPAHAEGPPDPPAPEWQPEDAWTP